MRSASMLEKAKELAVILAFDVPVDKEAEKLADELGIKIFKGALESLSRVVLCCADLHEQPTSSTISSTRSRRTTLRLWNRSESTRRPKQCGPSSSRSSPASPSEIVCPLLRLRCADALD